MGLKNKKNNIQGFTLVEMLVAVSIIALMSAIFLANYHGANNRNKIILAAQKLATDIRTAQNYALGAKEFQGSVPAGGWGAHLGSGQTSYIIFADLDEGYDYDTGEEYQTIALASGVNINNSNDTDIVFLPPNPITYINNNPVSQVEIELTDGNTTKKVLVNFAGLIDVVE